MAAVDRPGAPRRPRRPTPTQQRRRLALVGGAPILVAGLLAVLVLGRCGSEETGPSVATTAAPAVTTTIPGEPCPTEGWTLRRRLSQLVMVGVDPSGPDEARQVVEEEQVGGIFVGGSATGLLTSGALPELGGPDGVAPFVAVDDEGGRVQRIDALDGDLPSARELAGTRTSEEIAGLAEARGRALAGYGVTVDFAPSVDVSDQADDEVIGDRSFGDDPEVVARDARAFADGLAAAGILPVFKHFPGHGHAVGDSHEGTSTAPALDDLGPDLAPFRDLADRPGAYAVMVGHLVVPDLTDGEPASLSPAAIDGLLRDDLGYDGLVFTDELGGMRAVADRYGPTDAVERALLAGADVALLADAEDIGGILDGLEQAVADGDLPRARVDASLGRVLRAKGYACSG